MLDNKVQTAEATYPYLLTREQAANFLGIDPKSFDKYIRSHESLKSFFVGRHQRFTIQALTNFVNSHSV